MKTKFIKVSTADRLPEKEGDYFTVSRATGQQTGYFNGRSFAESFIDFEYWLEEKPDYEDEMKEMLEKVCTELYRTDNPMATEVKTLLTKLKES